MNMKDQLSGIKRKQLTTQDLKYRLFEKGAGHSFSNFKAPFTADSANQLLMVNLNSSNTSKFSPKVLRKQVAGFPSPKKNRHNFYRKDHVRAKQNLNTDQGIGFEEKSLKKDQCSSPVKSHNQSHLSPSNSNGFSQKQFRNETQQFRRTKFLVEKLSGKTKKRADLVHEKRKKPDSNNSRAESPIKENPFYQASKKSTFSEEPNLENYIRQAMKKTPNIEQFLYLVNSKFLKSNFNDLEENPYDLKIISYNETKKIEQRFSQKYYTVSKNGFCYYVNGKPVEFIELDEWVQEKQNYSKIKKLKFFNRFRRWKTIKMWKKVVLKHRLEECSKNLQEKLFFLNPIMRRCLFEVQEISLDMGKSIIIVSKNQGDYSLDNFKMIQEKTKRETSSIIEDFSRLSRDSVKTCFDDSIKQLRSSVKQKEEMDEKVVHQTSYLNTKDNAFQELGFPPKMSYENRSKLRKMAGSFVRFSYLVDMIHTAGLANFYQSQLLSFVEKLSDLQYNNKIEVVTVKQENKSHNNEDESEKMFNVKLFLQRKDIPCSETLKVKLGNSQKGDDNQFSPLYHIHSSEEPIPETKAFIPSICDHWLEIKPNFEDIYDEISSHLKEALNALKYFERWSKHREMEKYMNILEEWDDVVSDSRELAQNDNLDPVLIVKNFQTSLSNLKDIMTYSQQRLLEKLSNQLTGCLNTHYQHLKLTLEVLKDHSLYNPAETVQNFILYLCKQLKHFEQTIPVRVTLGVFEVNTQAVKVELLEKIDFLFEELKTLLPNIVSQHTEQLNIWLNKYRNVMKQQVKTIDDFIRTIKYMKQIDEQFEKKKQLCQNLSCIYQTMQLYKFDTKKRKQFQTTTLKLKDQLEQQINLFEQTYERKVELYSRQVIRNHVPSLVKDIGKLTDTVQESKFLAFGGKREDVLKQIKRCEEKYWDLERRKELCREYKQVLNLIDDDLEELDELKVEIQSRLTLWEEYNFWENKTNELDQMFLNDINLAELQEMMKKGETTIKKLVQTLPSNQILSALIEKIEILSVNIPIIVGIRTNLSEYHWQEIMETAQKVSTLDLKNRANINFSTFVESGVGKQKEAFGEIFLRAGEETKLQNQYEALEKKWQATQIRVRLEGKYHLINDSQEKCTIQEMFDEAMRSITRILANPYSSKLKISLITYQSITHGKQVFSRWLSVQDNLTHLDRVCKMLDTKKLSEFSMLENAEKAYRVILKYLLGRNVESSFKINKLTTPSSIIDDKLQECEQCLKLLEENISQLLKEYCRSWPIFLQFNESELLRILSDGNNPSTLEFIIKRVVPSIEKLRFESDRIVGATSQDGLSLIKTPISIMGDVEGIVEQVIESIADACRRMMRACRAKNMQSSIMEIIEEFNIQFLLAVAKVDFSHYTGISIENSQYSQDSLKDYLKILIKDTNDGIQKLKAKRYKQNEKQSLQTHEILLLQSLLNQQILQNLVRNDVRCANHYEWVKQLRFVWEENGTNLDETNISIKMMHASIRYGKQYVGSSSKVILSSHIDIILAIRYSELSLYDGHIGTLKNLIQSFGHKLVFVQCGHGKGIKELRNIFLSHLYSDCCFLMMETERLEQKVYESVIEGKEGPILNGLGSEKGKKLGKEPSEKLYSPVFFLNSPMINHQIGGLRDRYRIVSLPMPAYTPIYSHFVMLGIKHHELSKFIQKIFNQLSQLLGCAHPRLDLGGFLHNLLAKRPRSTHEVLNCLLQYLSPISHEYYQLMSEQVQRAFPDIMASERRIKTAEANQEDDEYYKEMLNTTKPVTIVTCAEDILTHYLQPIKGTRKQIELEAYTQEELYGNEEEYGIFQQITMGFMCTQLRKKSSLLNCLQPPESVKNDQTLMIVNGINQRLIHFLHELSKNPPQLIKTYVATGDHHLGNLQNDQQLALSRLLDPKLISEFWMVNLKTGEAYLDSKVQRWIQVNLPENQSVQSLRQTVKVMKNDSLVLGTISQAERMRRFYNSTFKHCLNTWFASQSASKKKEKVETFLQVLQTLLPTNNLQEAMIYSMILAFKESMEKQYIKLEMLVKKILGDDKLYEDVSLYDYVFLHGNQLAPPKQKNSFLDEEEPLQDRMLPIKLYMKQPKFSEKVINRGQHILTQQIIHYTIIGERALDSPSASLLLVGPPHSGKSTFAEIYRSMHHDNTAYLTVHLPNKKRKTLLNKIQNVLVAHDLRTMKAKLSYQHALVIVEDVGMESSEVDSPTAMLKMMIKHKTFFQLENKKHFSLEKVKFLMCSRKPVDMLDGYTLKLMFHGDRDLEGIFVEVLKANIFDLTQVPLDTPLKLISSAFNIFNHLRKVEDAKDREKNLDISLIKNMCLYVSHLRYKESLAVHLQLERFWIFLLHEHLEQLSTSITGDSNMFTSLMSNNGFQQYSGDSLSLYSFLHVKQQKYRHGKELQYVKDLKKLYNIINEKIQKYNESQIGDRRYGYSFEFVSIDEVLKNIVKMANWMISKDVVLCGRKGSDCGALVRLTSFLLGHNYREKKSGDILIELVKEILTDVTKVSSFLVAMRVNKENLHELLGFYDKDFETQIVGTISAHHHKKTSAPQNLIPNSKLMKSLTSMSSAMKSSFSTINLHEPKFTKLTYQELSKLRNSLKMVYYIDNFTYLKHLTKSVKEKVLFNFVNELPEESIIRFSKQIVQLSQLSYCAEAMEIITDIFKYCRGGLCISIKEYEDCIRLYSSFMAGLPEELKNRGKKLKEVIDLNQRLKSLVERMNKESEEMWEEKKGLAVKMKQIKEQFKYKEFEEQEQESNSQEGEIEELENKLIVINETLQQKIQLKCQCQKIISYFQETVQKYQLKHQQIEKYTTNSNYLQQTLAIAASYFTYLSKQKHASRTQCLKEWYQNIPILSRQPAQKRLTKPSMIFNLSREEEMFMEIDGEEEFYDNMTIILESIKPIMIKDDGQRGRRWLKEFDESFVTVDEMSGDFYEKLIRYLSEGHNILLEIHREQTFANLQTSYINSLIYMSDSTPTVEINGQEIEVSKESKVYIVVSLDTPIPEELQTEFLVVTYEQHPAVICENLTQDLVARLNPDAFFTIQECQKKMKDIDADCEKIQVAIVEALWTHFFGEETEKEGQKAKQKDDEEFMEQVWNFRKDISDRIQTLIDKIKFKKKMSKQFEDKVIDLSPSLHQQPTFSKILYFTYDLLQTFEDHFLFSSPTLREFGEIIKIAVNSGLIEGQLTLILFTLKQWGRALDEGLFLLLGCVLVARWMGDGLENVGQFVRCLEEGRRPSSKLNFYFELVEQKNNGNIIFNENFIEKRILDCLLKNSYDTAYEQLAPLHLNIKNPPVQLKKVYHLDNKERPIPHIVVLIGNQEPVMISTLRPSLQIGESIQIMEVRNSDNIEMELKKIICVEKAHILINGSEDLICKVIEEVIHLDCQNPINQDGLPEDFTIYCAVEQPKRINQFLQGLFSLKQKNLLTIVNLKNEQNLVHEYFKQKCPYNETVGESVKQSLQVTQKIISVVQESKQKEQKSKKAIVLSGRSQHMIEGERLEAQVTKAIIQVIEEYLQINYYGCYNNELKEQVTSLNNVLPEHFIKGIEQINQPISSDNQTWSSFKSIRAILTFLKNHFGGNQKVTKLLKAQILAYLSMVQQEILKLEQKQLKDTLVESCVLNLVEDINEEYLFKSKIQKLFFDEVIRDAEFELFKLGWLSMMKELVHKTNKITQKKPKVGDMFSNLQKIKKQQVISIMQNKRFSKKNNQVFDRTSQRHKNVINAVTKNLMDIIKIEQCDDDLISEKNYSEHLGMEKENKLFDRFIKNYWLKNELTTKLILKDESLLLQNQDINLKQSIERVLLEKNIVPISWRFFLNSYFKHNELQPTLSVILQQRKTVDYFLNKAEKAGTPSFDELLNPLSLIKAYLQTENYEINLQKYEGYYLVQNLTTEQVNCRASYIHWKVGYAEGWKLSNEGTLETCSGTSPMKDIFIVKRPHIGQILTCEIDIMDHMNSDPTEVQTLKVYVYVKKVIPDWTGKLYLLPN